VKRANLVGCVPGVRPTRLISRAPPLDRHQLQAGRATTLTCSDQFLGITWNTCSQKL
jgi:hypothetical protein